MKFAFWRAFYPLPPLHRPFRVRLDSSLLTALSCRPTARFLSPAAIFEANGPRGAGGLVVVCVLEIHDRCLGYEEFWWWIVDKIDDDDATMVEMREKNFLPPPSPPRPWETSSGLRRETAKSLRVAPRAGAVCADAASFSRVTRRLYRSVVEGCGGRKLGDFVLDWVWLAHSQSWAERKRRVRRLAFARRGLFIGLGWPRVGPWNGILLVRVPIRVFFRRMSSKRVEIEPNVVSKIRITYFQICTRSF